MSTTEVAFGYEAEVFERILDAAWWVCEVEVPALLFRVGEPITERCGHVRWQIVQHEV